jgi:hypothetical protein
VSRIVSFRNYIYFFFRISNDKKLLKKETVNCSLPSLKKEQTLEEKKKETFVDRRKIRMTVWHAFMRQS